MNLDWGLFTQELLDLDPVDLVLGADVLYDSKCTLSIVYTHSNI